MRLKDVAYLNRHALSETTDPDFAFRYVDIGSVDAQGHISPTEEFIRFEDSPSRARRIAPAGGVVVSTVRTYLRAIAQVPELDDDLVFSTGFAVLESKVGVDCRFLGYLCQAEEFVAEVVSRSVGVSYPAINPGDLASIPVSLPALDVQRRTADFLDYEIGTVDRLVRQREAQRTILKERMNSVLVSHILCDRDNSFRTRLKFLFSSNRNGLWGDDPTGGSDDLTCVRVADFQRDRYRADPEASTTRSIPASVVKDRILRRGDILLEKSGGGEQSPVGFAVTFDSAARSVCSNFIAALRVADGINPRFACLVLSAFYRSGRNVPYIKQATGIQNLDGGAYLAQELWVPAQREQAKIAQWFDQELEQALTIESSINRQTALLGQRRQALISAAVTGQINVTIARGVSG